MQKILFFSLLTFTQFVFGQNVILNKVAKVSDNTDKFLYRIDSANADAEYLGEVEVQGFSNDDTEVFGKIYAKAKEIGANAFTWKPFETIESGVQKIDPAHYRLSLYYLEASEFPKEDNVIYLISSPYSKQKIGVNNQTISFERRTYTKMKLQPGTVYTISTKKFLGTSIRLSAQENQPVQYFQFSAFSVNTNDNGNAGINLKSGDIVRLEQSYAQFLTTIYELKP